MSEGQGKCSLPSILWTQKVSQSMHYQLPVDQPFLTFLSCDTLGLSPHLLYHWRGSELSQQLASERAVCLSGSSWISTHSPLLTVRD